APRPASHKIASKRSSFSNIPNSAWRRSGASKWSTSPPLSSSTTRATTSSRRSPERDGRLAADAVPDALLAGDGAAWAGFVRRYGGLIVAAVRGIALLPADVEDLTQEVFVRLCKDNFRLLRSYDPARAALSTWLTIVARSTARDA